MATALPATPIERADTPSAAIDELRLPPGPRVPAMALTLAWALAPTWVMDRCAARLGDAFTLTFAPSGLKLAMFSDPEAVKAVFTAPPMWHLRQPAPRRSRR